MPRFDDGWDINLTRQGRVWGWSAFLWDGGLITMSGESVIPRLTEESAENAAKRFINRTRKRGGAERKFKRYEP